MHISGVEIKLNVYENTFRHSNVSDADMFGLYFMNCHMLPAPSHVRADSLGIVLLLIRVLICQIGLGFSSFHSPYRLRLHVP
jgi:hypothetical protein